MAAGKLKSLGPRGSRTNYPFANLPTSKSGQWGEGVTADEMDKYTWLRPDLEAEIKIRRMDRFGPVAPRRIRLPPRSLNASVISPQIIHNEKLTIRLHLYPTRGAKLSSNRQMGGNKSNTLRKASLGGSIVAAISASLCCLGPLIAILIGASGFAAASALATWRPLFLVLTFALLGLAWFLTYRRPKTSEAYSTCPITPASRWNKPVLVLATAVVLLFAGFPYLSSAVLRLRSDLGQQAKVTDAVLKVSIPSMDCAACATSIQRQITEQPGVQNAQVSFDAKQAVVYYHANRISRDQLIRAINNTGFKAEPLDK